MKTGFITLLYAFMAVTLSAQTQKIGYIDSEFILSKIPEYTGLSERMNVLSQQWKKELDEMQKEVDELQKDYDGKAILFTEEVKQQKLKEIEAKKQKINQFRTAKFGPTGEYFRKQQELLEPLQQRILEAVSKIAARDNYDFIFDRTGDYLFLYTKPQWNLSEDVLYELGIEPGETGN